MPEHPAPNKKPFLLWRLLGWFGRLIDLLRRITLNLIFLAVILLLILGVRREIAQPIPQQGILVVAPHGSLVEQTSVSPFEQAMRRLSGSEEEDIAVPELLETLHRAGSDARLQAVALDLSELGGASLTKAQSVAQAITRLRKNNPRLKVLVFAPSYDQNSYLIASAADEIYMDPMGTVMIPGLAAGSLYFKDFLEQLGVDVHIFRVGAYKSAGEPLSRNDMSPEARDNMGKLLADLWHEYLSSVAQARHIPEQAVKDYADHLPMLLRDHQGDGAALAKERGLITDIGDSRAFRARLAAITHEDADDLTTISWQNYHAQLRHNVSRAKAPIGIVTIQGMLMDEAQQRDQADAGDLADLIAAARKDTSIKALVVRIDSPGGSAHAAEVIRKELEAVREAHKPVVISMGSVAASGGYWIASAGDTIIANPGTITGSIGVIGLMPSFVGTLAKLRLHSDEVTTTPYATALSPLKPMDPVVAQATQAVVDNIYRQFVSLVAQSRNLPVATVEQNAGGQVFSGLEARRRKLVDELGDLDVAIKEARRRARLDDQAKARVLLPKTDFDFGMFHGITSLTMLAQVAQGDSLVSTMQSMAQRVVAGNKAHILALCPCTAP